jgi:hypothetical protein
MENYHMAAIGFLDLGGQCFYGIAHPANYQLTELADSPRVA